MTRCKKFRNSDDGIALVSNEQDTPGLFRQLRILSNASSVASYLRYTHDTRPISCWTESSGLGGGGALGAVRPVNDVTGRGRCGRWRTRELDHHPQFRTHHQGGCPAAPAAALGRADLSYTQQASPSVHSKTPGGSALDVGQQQWFIFGSGGRRGGVTGVHALGINDQSALPPPH